MHINHSLHHLDLANLEYTELLKQADARRLARSSDAEQTGDARLRNRLRSTLASLGAALTPSSRRHAAGKELLIPFTR